MIYKAMAVWLALQIPLGMLVGLMLRGAGVMDRIGQEDDPDVKAAAALAGMAMELRAG